MIGISIGCMAYALIRYALFKGVPLTDTPAYLLNKAASVAATIFLAMAAWHAWRKSPEVVYWGKLTWTAVVLHGLLSFGIFGTEFFPAWFEDGKPNLTGQLVLLTGVLGAIGMLEVRLRKRKDASGESILIFVSVITLLHVVIMGGKKWFIPADWPGGMPNMSMLGAIAAAIAAFFYLRTLRRGKPDHENQYRSDDPE